MHNGRIVESGNHDQLIKHNQHYYRLVHAQLIKKNNPIDHQIIDGTK